MSRWVLTDGHAGILEVDEASFVPELTSEDIPRPKKWYEFTWDGVLLESRGKNIFPSMAEAQKALAEQKVQRANVVQKKILRAQRRLDMLLATSHSNYVKPAGMCWGNKVLDDKMPRLHDGMHLVLGPTCSGKTTFLFNMALANLEKGRILWISNEELPRPFYHQIAEKRNFYFVKGLGYESRAEDYLGVLDTLLWTPAWLPCCLVVLDDIRLFGNPHVEGEANTRRAEIVSMLAEYQVPFVITEQVSRTGLGLPGKSAEARTALNSPWVGLCQSVVLLNLHARKQTLEILSTTGHVDVWKYKTPVQGHDATL